MTAETKKVVDSEIEFFGRDDANNYNITYETTKDGKEGRISVKLKEEIRVYKPIDYFEFMIFTWADKAHKAKLPNGELDLDKQAKIYVELRWRTVLVVERFLRKMEGYPDCRKYDFSGIYRMIDGAIEESKLNLEIKLLNSQTEANKSTVEANGIAKTANIFIALFTSFAGIWYLRSFLDDVIPNTSCCNKPVIVISLTFLLFGVVAYMAHQWLLKRDKPQKKQEQKDS